MGKPKSARTVAREQVERYRTIEAINHFAMREGWAIFNTGDCDEIERIDCPDDGTQPKFDGDDAALRHVQAIAAYGSELHRAALAIHEQDSPSSGDNAGHAPGKESMA